VLLWTSLTTRFIIETWTEAQQDLQLTKKWSLLQICYVESNKRVHYPHHIFIHKINVVELLTHFHDILSLKKNRTIKLREDLAYENLVSRYTQISIVEEKVELLVVSVWQQTEAQFRFQLRAQIFVILTVFLQRFIDAYCIAVLDVLQRTHVNRIVQVTQFPWIVHPVKIIVDLLLLFLDFLS